ncbi:MAG: glycosyltransferase family 2 protein [Anaerolineaceae bacterium]
MKNLPTCSVVVPVYNSQSTLNELARRLKAVLDGLCSEYELILVNDGSRDASWDEIRRLSSEFSWVKGVNMMRNYGQHNALLCGVRQASHEIVITMDDDLQHPPEEIHKLLEKLAEGYDVVYGIPQKLPHAFWRNIFSKLTKRILAWVMGIPTVRDIGAFRAFRTRLRTAFENFQSPTVILDVLLSWATTSFAATKVDENQREVGASNYNFSKLVSQAMLILTGYSTAPLRFVSILGFTFTLFGLVLFIFVIISYFTAGSIQGFTFLASIVSIFSGTQLFALGIFGEYLARIFDRSMERPSYVIGETTGKNKAPRS